MKNGFELYGRESIILQCYTDQKYTFVKREIGLKFSVHVMTHAFVPRAANTAVSNRLYLTYHRVGVDLTHVLTAVFFLYVFYVQVPRRIVRVGYGHSRIVRDDVIVDGLDSFRVGFYPSNLKIKCTSESNEQTVKSLFASEHGAYVRGSRHGTVLLVQTFLFLNTGN